MPRHMAGIAGLFLALGCTAVGVPRASADPFIGYGGITSDTTWTGTVTVTGDVIVQEAASLTVAPGTRVQFKPRASDFDHASGTANRCDIIVNGRLIAGGPTPADSVVFTSNSPPGTQVAGDWGFLRFDSTSVDSACLLQNVRVRWATRGAYITGAAPTIVNSTFDDCSVAGLDGDTIGETCHISGILVRNATQYGIRFTGFEGSILRSRFTNAGRNAGVWLKDGSGRFAENVVESHTFTNAVGLLLDGSNARVALDTLRLNANVVGTSVAMRIIAGSAVAVESCSVSGNNVGIQTVSGAPYIGRTQFAGNGVAVDCQMGGVPVVGDSLSMACDFTGNAVTVRNVKGNTTFIRAHYNYWGTVVEDSIFTHTQFGVDASPWTDAAHTAVIRATSYGVLTNGVTWSGVVTVRGDLIIPDTVAVVVTPGTIVRVQAGFATWDTTSTLNIGLPDLQVFGQLAASGVSGDSIRFTSTAAAPARGDWGTIYFAPGSSGSLLYTVIEYAVDGVTCIGAPSISRTQLRHCLHSGVHGEQSDVSLSQVDIGWNGTGATFLTGGDAFLGQCTVHDNTGDGIYAFNMPGAPTIESSTITRNTVGVHLAIAAAVVRGSTITANTQYGIAGENADGAQVGESGAPNTISGNGVAGIANLTNTEVMHAGNNFWGTEVEDQIAAAIQGSVDYSPFYNAALTFTFAAASYGTLSSDAGWVGTRWLRGDLIVPANVSLTIDPGTRVIAWSNRTASDGPGGVALRPDILVYGKLYVGTAGGGRVQITSDAAAPAPGNWGFIRLFPGASSTDSIVNATIAGWSGLRVDSAAPALGNDSLGAGVDTTLRFGNSSVKGRAGVAIAAPYAGVGLAMSSGSPVVSGWTITGGSVGVALSGTVNPSFDPVVVTGADTAIVAGGTATPRVAHAHMTANHVGLAVRTGASPLVETSVIQHGGVGAGIGVLVQTGGTHVDLGGGPLGSSGQNVIKGYAGSSLSQYDVFLNPVTAGDTVYAHVAYWGTPDSTQVPDLVFDHADNASCGYVLTAGVQVFDTAARSWSVTSTRDDAVHLTIACDAPAGASLDVWRAPVSDDGATPSWPAAFAWCGRAVVSARGVALYDDRTADRARAMAYVITAAGDPLRTPLADVRVDAIAQTGQALAVSTVHNATREAAIVLDLPTAQHARVLLLDVAGRQVARLVDQTLPAGRHELPLAAGPRTVPAGVYVAHVTVGDEPRIVRVVLR